MSILIFILWFMRVMTISLDNQLLRFGVPVLLLSLIGIFVLINRQALPLLWKTKAFRYYLFLLLVLMLSSAVALKNGFPIIASISSLLKFLLMGSFLVLGFILAIYGKQKLALFFIISTIMVHMLAGVGGYFLGVGDVIHGVFRPTGLAGKVNILANLALFTVMFAGVLLVMDKKHRLTMAILVLLALTMIFLSGTLKNVISLVGAIGIYVLLGSKRKVLAITLMLFIGVPALVGLAVYTPIGDRLMEAFVAGVDVDIEEGQKLESSLQWRVLHWKLLLDDWYSRFLLSGSGFGQVGNMNALKTTSGEGFVAHSDWIEFWVELGPFLFLAFLFGHYKILKPVYESAKSGNTLALALFFAFISQSIAMLAGPVYFSVSFFYYFWILLGIVVANNLNNSIRQTGKNR